MKIAKRLLAIIFFVILAGCATKSVDSFTWYKLKPGMTKTEVISTLGQPDSVSVSDDKSEEILIYNRTQQTFSALFPIPARYKVFIRNDKYVRFTEQFGI